MTRLLFGSMFLALVIAGCRTMHRVDPGSAERPGDGKSVVVFMRATRAMIGGRWSSSVFDLKEDEKLIGILSNGEKVAYVTEPGEHLFMVISENADFLGATLLPGRTYYALVVARMGLLKSRFSLEPVRAAQLNSKAFEDWRDSTHSMETTAKSYTWADENRDSIREKRAAYLPKWMGKPQTERDEQTLRPEDGR